MNMNEKQVKISDDPNRVNSQGLVDDKPFLKMNSQMFKKQCIGLFPQIMHWLISSNIV